MLRKIRAKRCRGIVDGPDLPIGSGGLLLCGSNGTGKSSFIDALDFALTGKSSSLDTGVRGLSWNTHGTHVLGNGAPEVELTFEIGGTRHVWTRNGTAAPPAQLKAFIDAVEGNTFLLRRKTILEFIDAQPAERYKALEGFFSLDSFVNFENKLKLLSSGIQQRLKSAQDAQRNLDATLRLTCEVPALAAVDLPACIALVNSSLESITFAPIADLDLLPVRSQEVQTALRQFQNMDVVSKLRSVSEFVQSLPNLLKALNTGGEYLALMEKCLDEEAKLKGHFLDEVLKDGLKWIEQDELNCCPLCEQPIDRTKLAETIQKRLAQNEGLSKIRTERDQSSIEFSKLVKVVVAEWAKLPKQWKAALGEDLPENVTNIIASLAALASESRIEVAALKAVLSGLAGLDLDASKATLVAHVQLKALSFPDYAAYQRLVRANAHLTAVHTFVQQSRAISSQIAKLEADLTNAKILAGHADAARKGAVQRTVETITNQADLYFRTIHPGENIGKPVLTVPRQGAGSLQLRSDFYGRESDPRGYYSEGHVDSLGLCLFLALRRLHHQRRPEFALLVLDDVLHSVDGEHRRATADLIFREFGDHQIVITTHDLLWFEQLKRAARQHAAGRKFEERRIGSWSISEGPVWGDHHSNREWLASSKADEALPADRVMKAGRLLEEMLQNLCHNLTISVPFNVSGRYTLDPLWSAFTSKASEYKEFSAATQDEMLTLKAHIASRNTVGGHHNEWAQGFTPEEAKAFSDAALRLHERTFCSRCNGFIKRIKDLDGVWSCMGEHLKYRKKPQVVSKP
jgi:hypothetical protein